MWNIHGSGGIEPRRLVVEGVVKELDPDVILLQEVKSNPLIDEIKKGVTAGKEDKAQVYENITAGKKDEAQILYKKIKFQRSLPTEERAVLERTIEVVAQENRMITRNWKQTFKERTSIVRLTTKGYDLVFLSFHNVNSGLSQLYSTQFCQIVSQISKTTQCIVIAGADANYKLPFGKYQGCTVLKYVATERRKKEIDHFILAAPRAAPRGTYQIKVEALNFVDTKDGQKLHPLMTSLKPQLKSIKYHEVLDKGLDKKDDDLHKALDSKLEGDLDKSLVEALGESLDNGLEEGLKKVSDEPQLRGALLEGLKKTLHEALDQALCIDKGMISNHDPILLDMTIDTKKSQWSV